jgi:hypothetical protein
MAYVNPDYKTKKDFVEAVNSGKVHYTYNPSEMYPTKQNGQDVIEGPHYPKPHRWYARVEVKDGAVVKVLR